MKRFFLFHLITLFCGAYMQAQEVKMASIPYPMHFENKVSDYKVMSDNHIRIVAPANTDLYISADGGYVKNLSPRLIFRPDSVFILTAKITPDFKSIWDAGDLLIFNDSKHFAKFCFERDFKGQARVVSVVCNDISDDCNSMVINTNWVYYRITGSTKSNVFALYYSEDGKSWFPVRSFILTKTDNLQIGFSSQSPVGSGCSVDFSEISFLSSKPKDYWKGE